MLASRKNQKLAAKFFGPFEVLERNGYMAYKFDLPTELKLNSIFHISTLKPYHEGSVNHNLELPPIPAPDHPQPLAILDHRFKARQLEVLIDWSHS